MKTYVLDLSKCFSKIAELNYVFMSPYERPAVEKWVKEITHNTIKAIPDRKRIEKDDYLIINEIHKIIIFKRNNSFIKFRHEVEDNNVYNDRGNIIDLDKTKIVS